MSPRLIVPVCPNCKRENKAIPRDMGDKTLKCQRCRKFIRYKWRENRMMIIDRPERATTSGLVLY